MKCGTKTCRSGAVVRAFWPGQHTVFCDPCARRAAGVAAVMGFQLMMEMLPGSEELKDALYRLGDPP
jgi:hypothetical protein